MTNHPAKQRGIFRGGWGGKDAANSPTLSPLPCFHITCAVNLFALSSGAVSMPSWPRVRSMRPAAQVPNEGTGGGVCIASIFSVFEAMSKSWGDLSRSTYSTPMTSYTTSRGGGKTDLSDRAGVESDRFSTRTTSLVVLQKPTNRRHAHVLSALPYRTAFSARPTKACLASARYSPTIHDHLDIPPDQVYRSPRDRANANHNSASEQGGKL